MTRLLIVEKSVIICAVFKKLLTKDGTFEFDIVHSYKEAQILLQKNKYDFAVVDRILPDAKDGQVISLLNKHEIAPIIYTKSIDEEFIESFGSSNIIDYILKHRQDNVTYVIDRIKQLIENKKSAILVAHKSNTYVNYLRTNLTMHNFKVISVENGYEAISKLHDYKNIKLLIVDKDLANINGLEDMNGYQLVRKIRADKNLRELGILSLSDESNTFTTSFFLNEGADDYLIKPFSRDEFYQRIYKNIN